MFFSLAYLYKYTFNKKKRETEKGRDGGGGGYYVLISMIKEGQGHLASVFKYLLFFHFVAQVLYNKGIPYVHKFVCFITMHCNLRMHKIINVMFLEMLQLRKFVL